MTRRNGVTLVEVLVAIFITGIGLISLLTLFPLAALNMNQAIKDQRSADASRNAASIAKIFNIRDDATVFAAYNAAQGVVAPAAGSGPSFPVLVDPKGWLACGGSGTYYVGGQSPGIPRVMPKCFNPPPGGVPQPQYLQRFTTLLDEMNFTPDGSSVDPGNPGVVQRVPRYSWAWLCQQGKATTVGPPTGVPGVNMTVVVFDRRSLVPGTAAGTLLEEYPCTANFTAGSNVARLSWTGAQPPIKRNTWILDSTITPNIHGYFYRVVNVTPVGGNAASVELHMNAIAGATNGQAVVMDKVVEVFTRGP